MRLTLWAAAHILGLVFTSDPRATGVTKTQVKSAKTPRIDPLFG